MTKAVVNEIINSAIHRFLADGVYYRDLIDIRNSMPNWEAWPDTWSKWAAAHEKRAEESLASGARLTAGTDFARASLYYHYAQNILVDDLKRKKAVHDLKVAAFKRAAPLLDPPLQRVEIPFAGIKMAAYLRLPPQIKSPPCVVLLGGLDTTKEDYQTINDLMLQRGLATLAFDGPGQGETQFEMLWRKDFGDSVRAVFDFLEETARDRPQSRGHYWPQHRRPLLGPRGSYRQTRQGRRDLGRDVSPSQYRGDSGARPQVLHVRQRIENAG